MKSKLHLAAALLLLGITAGPQVGAQTGTDPETGVWYELRQAGLPAPVPPQVTIPEDGLWLSSDPGGDRSVSAVRFSASASDVPEALTLRVADNYSTTLAFSLCAAKNEWKPPADRPGAWEERAVPDCATKRLEGKPTSDGSAVEFALTGYGAGETVDLVLTRNPGDSQSYINVTFDRPAGADLKVGTSVSSGGFADPSTFSDGGGSSALGTGTGDSGGVGSFGSGSTGGGSNFDTPEPADSGTERGPAASGDGDNADAGDNGVAAPATRSRGGDGWESSQKIAFAALAVLLLSMAWIVSRRLSAGGTAGPTYTIYRGAPPQ